jgi:ADP-heptose:LPS heptosyltransferase
MRILFVTSNRIGDAVLSTGLLGALIERHPNAHVWVACGPLPAPLFLTAPQVERVLVMNKQARGGHWLNLWRRVVGRFWDLVVDLRGSAISWLVPAARRIVGGKGDRSRHRVEDLAGLIGADPAPAPRLWLDGADRAAAARLLPADRTVLALAPTANWEGKRWAAERFAELSLRLTAPGAILAGAAVALFGASHERPMAAPLLAALPAEICIDLIGQLDLRTAAACFERAALFVGNDSGLMHMAAAVGARTLGLFGPSPEVHYAPYGPRTAIARTDQSYHALVTAPDFDHIRTPSLMDGLSVDAAVDAAEALWRRTT